MKKRIVLLLTVLSLGIILIGCQSQKNMTSTDNVEEQYEFKLIKEAMIDPRQSDSWTEVEEFKYDFNKDSKEDTIGLYTTAGRDKKGNLMWDDGQKWLLLVQSGDKYYTLLHEYIQLGNAYFTVSKCLDNVTMKVTVIVPAGAGLSMTSFIYDSDKQGFLKQSLYRSEENNFLYISIPHYK